MAQFLPCNVHAQTECIQARVQCDSMLLFVTMIPGEPCVPLMLFYVTTQRRTNAEEGKRRCFDRLEDSSVCVINTPSFLHLR